MKKLYIVLIIVIAVIAIGASYLLKMYNKVTPDTKDLKADITVDVNKMTSDFKADTGKARKMYDNKIVLLTGTIDKIEKDQSGHANVFFVANGINVQCTMDTAKSASEGIAEKMAVKLKTQYSGYEPADIDPMPIIKFKKCVTEK